MNEMDFYRMGYDNGKREHKKEGGIGFCGLLTITFIILKLCKVIDWSWIWVLSPLWIPFALVVTIFIIIVIFALIKKI